MMLVLSLFAYDSKRGNFSLEAKSETLSGIKIESGYAFVVQVEQELYTQPVVLLTGQDTTVIQLEPFMEASGIFADRNGDLIVTGIVSKPTGNRMAAILLSDAGIKRRAFWDISEAGGLSNIGTYELLGKHIHLAHLSTKDRDFLVIANIDRKDGTYTLIPNPIFDRFSAGLFAVVDSNVFMFSEQEGLRTLWRIDEAEMIRAKLPDMPRYMNIVDFADGGVFLLANEETSMFMDISGNSRESLRNYPIRSILSATELGIAVGYSKKRPDGMHIALDILDNDFALIFSETGEKGLPISITGDFLLIGQRFSDMGNSLLFMDAHSLLSD